MSTATTEVPVQRVLRLRSGDFIGADQIETEGLYPVYGGNGLRGFTDRWNTEGPMVLIGRQGAHCGNVHVVHGKCWVSEHALRCIPEKTFSANFIGYALRSLGLNRYSVSAAQPGLSTDNIKPVLLPFPSLKQQERIAAFLDDKTAKIDALIEKKRTLLDRLAEKRQAIITQAVTKGLNPAAPMKDSGIEWLGAIPAHWETWPLKRYLSEALYGVSASLEPTGEVGILRMGNLRDGELDFTDLRFLDQVDDAIILRSSDIVFNRTNSLDLVGKAAIYRGDYNGALSLASYLVLFRFDGRYDPEFANYVMGANVLMALARTLALPSIGQANLNPNRYAANSFPVPPVAEQREIVTYISSKLKRLKNIETHVRASEATLDEYRSTLITAAVTGKIKGLR